MKGHTMLSWHAIISHEKFPSIFVTYIKIPTETKSDLTRSWIHSFIQLVFIGLPSRARQ